MQALAQGMLIGGIVGLAVNWFIAFRLQRYWWRAYITTIQAMPHDPQATEVALAMLYLFPVPTPLEALYKRKLDRDPKGLPVTIRRPQG